MRIRLGSGLVPMNLLVLVLIVVVVLFPYESLRIALGIPFVIFLPGYSLMLALFPGRERIGNAERIALSFGLSIAVIPLIGLILNYTPFGITVESTLYSAAGFIFIMSFIALLRLVRMDESQRFGIEFKVERFTAGSGRDKAVTAMLIIAVIAAAGALVYVLTTPKAGDRFTEFYILGLEGEAGEYPTELSVGEEASVILGIVYHEQETVEYRVKIVVDGAKYDEMGPLGLDYDEKWEDAVTFSVDKPGDNQEVEFLLYRGGETEPYLEPLHLLVDVTG